jgi:hypothetical protein
MPLETAPSAARQMVPTPQSRVVQCQTDTTGHDKLWRRMLPDRRDVSLQRPSAGPRAGSLLGNGLLRLGHSAAANTNDGAERTGRQRGRQGRCSPFPCAPSSVPVRCCCVLSAPPSSRCCPLRCVPWPLLCLPCRHQPIGLCPLRRDGRQAPRQQTRTQREDSSSKGHTRRTGEKGTQRSLACPLPFFVPRSVPLADACPLPAGCLTHRPRGLVTPTASERLRAN